MKKLLIITYYWPPAGGPGVQRWLKLSKYLPCQGVKPYVITVHQDKATYPLRDESLLKEVHEEVEVISTNTGELFSFYKRASGRKEVPFSGFANESDRPGPRQKFARFIRGNFFLPDARKSWNRHAFKAAMELIQIEGIRTVITTGPPHSTQLIGLKLKKKLGVKWIADFRDPWTDIYYYRKFYPTAIARNIDVSWEKKVVEGADVVLTVSNDLGQLLTAKSDRVNPDKFKLLPNGFDPSDYSQNIQAHNDLFTITYAGTITDQYPVSGMLNMINQSNIKDRIQLRFIGRRDQSSEKLLIDYQDKLRISIEGYLSKAKLSEQLGNSDALLLVIPDIPANKGIITGKLFDYMGSGKPIIGIGPLDGDAAAVINECQCGKMFTNDGKGVPEYLNALQNNENNEFQPILSEINKYSRREQAFWLVNLIV